MIVNYLNRHNKYISLLLFTVIYAETVLANKAWDGSSKAVSNVASRQNFSFEPARKKESLKKSSSSLADNKELEFERKENPFQSAKKKVDIGPDQPESSSFTSVNANNMVDLFTGDFSYNIPLLDVGGYPVNLAYRSGITMDQEASWVGLGWNVNPGAVTRNKRGLPDDFNGKNDSIRKVTTIRENKTVGVSAGVGLEVVGFPVTVGVNVGVFHNNYKGWGIEKSINCGINSGNKAKGHLTGGLSITNNTQEGISINPSISVKLKDISTNDKGIFDGSVTVGLPYNSRSGIRSLQVSSGARLKIMGYSGGAGINSSISFASPSFTPTISIPYTSTNFSYSQKAGMANSGAFQSVNINGYVSKQYIANDDTSIALPSYGYLNYYEGSLNRESLLDFNREREIPFRDKPAVPHIALPIYTYDAFSITGEGTGGMFRAYRGDIGFVFDHAMRTRDNSESYGIDAGLGNIAHIGYDINLNRAFTQTGPWLDENVASATIDFTPSSGNYEAVYFRNPGEKSINSKQFYEALGGDDLVALDLYQSDKSSPSIKGINYLRRYYKNGVSQLPLNSQTVKKPERDKRSQVISYLTAKEASIAAFSRYIESYQVNQFSLNSCTPFPAEAGGQTGLSVEYYANTKLQGTPVYTTTDATLHHDWLGGSPHTSVPANDFSGRWTGRVKSPITGQVIFQSYSDDGVRLWINDSLVMDHWYDQHYPLRTCTLNLIEAEFYKLKYEFYENGGDAGVQLKWKYTDNSQVGHDENIPAGYLFLPDTVESYTANGITREKRVNKFRKENHISQISVLNDDGRRYIYGIPVYNLKEKDVTFSISKANGNSQTGLVKYTHGTDNSSQNSNGKEWYYNREEIPSYAHSFLLTSILSSDYVDVTANGVSDDDIGDAIKFNYTKIRGVSDPFKWRAPYVKDSASYNEGLKTDNRDDKGSYSYGEKELWYLHSIESKTMVATFVLEDRKDLLEINEAGEKQYNKPSKRLKEINLYSKSDFIKNGSNAKAIKTVHFEYSYDLCRGMYKTNTNPGYDTGKLTLKKVWFSYNGNNKGIENPYVFSYHEKNPSYNNKSYDRWGNYKEPLHNPGSTISNLIDNVEYPYALQDSLIAAGNIAAWTLDSIILPSGGSMKVDFESDDYAFVQNKRASQFFKIAGFGFSQNYQGANNKMYGMGDKRYVFIKLSEPVVSATDFYQKYLKGHDTMFFKLAVTMPSDNYGSGHEYVSCYAHLSKEGNNYGIANSQVGWILLEGISLKGSDPGNYSPLVKASVQYLRQNLPSKAYPGSEVGDNIDLQEAISMAYSFSASALTAFVSFDAEARLRNYAKEVDTSRSFVRLNNPVYKKYGGGLRVKCITIYDNWDKMTNSRAAKYGQEYSYTTIKEINGENKLISSGVASYEPLLGNEENPFRVPMEYVERVSLLGPVSLGYTEEPLGESLFPSAGIGYSKVRVRTINHEDKKSANGYDESCFYTAYDFPVFTNFTPFDEHTKKRFKPFLANFLKVNARHFLTVSQGFRIELNDMHGKLRSQASYPETDPENPVVYTENIYRVVDPKAEHKKLSNVVTVIKPNGSIDTTALIGKDVELMMDFREQMSYSGSLSIQPNIEIINAGFPFAAGFSYIFPQREETRFRSAATLKVIQRYGILDSVIHVDKGSRVTTKDLVYDSETGAVLLNRTQNEFNDSLYSFTYPSHWAYDGMGFAFRNIDVVLKNLRIKDGKIVSGLAVADSNYFSNGDEILAYGKQKTGTISSCSDAYSNFPYAQKLWVVDKNAYIAGPRAYYLIDSYGKPYNGYDVNLRIIRSGRRNINAAVGSVTSLKNPLVKDPLTQQYSIQLSTASKVIATSAMEYSDKWFRNQKCIQCNGSLNGSNCIHDTTAVGNEPQQVQVCSTLGHKAYSSCGTYLYSEFDSSYTPFARSQFASGNSFWINLDDTSKCSYTPITSLAENETPDVVISRDTTCEGYGSTLGPLNRCGIWLCSEKPDETPTAPLDQWVSIVTQVEIGDDKTYYIGMGGDNRVRVYIDGVLFKEDDPTIYETYNGTNDYNPENFKIWHLYPVYLEAGTHYLKIEALNGGCEAVFGVEIYNNTEEELADASSYNNLNIVFSTKDLNGEYLPEDYEYQCPEGYSLIFEDGQPVCRKVAPATTFDNPLTGGLMGNWRSKKSYVYYAARAESDPTDTTDIRRNGSFIDYTPFWAFANGKLVAQYDTTRWVWNSEITDYNRKGLEIENKDPLGRFNSGQYGYNLTLPVAVAQNSKARESAFEGFEDYDVGIELCDNDCKDTRHIDYTSYKHLFSTAEKHTGKRSIKLNASSSVTIVASVADSTFQRSAPVMSLNTTTNSCYPGQNLMTNISYTNNELFSKFQPSKGRKMVLSAWVKEEQNCNCTTYTNNRIIVSLGTASYTFQPSGPIIEGWQRYEAVFDVPLNASTFNVTLQANNSISYFDDLRIHPFNSNMKSFVYDPISLRLMAELDKNNYAAFYEYDDDGTLIRVKKETDRGIKTIKETRSALVKDL